MKKSELNTRPSNWRTNCDRNNNVAVDYERSAPTGIYTGLVKYADSIVMTIIMIIIGY